MNTVLAFLLLILFLMVYFMPTVYAHGKRNFQSIFIVNLFLGWTIIGWVVALAWACYKEKKEEK